MSCGFLYARCRVGQVQNWRIRQQIKIEYSYSKITVVRPTLKEVISPPDNKFLSFVTVNLVSHTHWRFPILDFCYTYSELL